MATETKTMKVRRSTEQEIDRLRNFLNQLSEHVEDTDEEDEDANDAIVTLVRRSLPNYEVVLFNLVTLLENCADLNQRTLEFAPWINEQQEVLKEIDEYLDGHDQNYIGHRSKLHQKVKTLIKA